MFDTHNCPIVNRVVSVESGVVWKKNVKQMSIGSCVRTMAWPGELLEDEMK